MMLVNHDILWAIAQARQAELLEDMRMRQMWRQVVKTKRSSPKFWRRLNWRLGGSMIAVGHRLQAQQQLKQL